MADEAAIEPALGWCRETGFTLRSGSNQGDFPSPGKIGRQAGLRRRSSATHLYFCRYTLRDIARYQRRYLDYLTAEEINKWRSFKCDHARAQFLLGRVLLRSLLAAYTGWRARQIEFSFNRYGRPGWAVHNCVDFNLAHTQGLLAITIGSQLHVGVDVERVRPGDQLLKISRHCFHEREAAAIAAMESRELQVAAFFDFWTLKEAYLKALGQGLQKSLQSFYFEWQASQRIVLHDSAHDRNCYRASLYAIDDCYRLAMLELPRGQLAGQLDCSPRVYQVQADLSTSAVDLYPVARSPLCLTR